MNYLQSYEVAAKRGKPRLNVACVCADAEIDHVMDNIIRFALGGVYKIHSINIKSEQELLRIHECLHFDCIFILLNNYHLLDSENNPASSAHNIISWIQTEDPTFIVALTGSSDRSEIRKAIDSGAKYAFPIPSGLHLVEKLLKFYFIKIVNPEAAIKASPIEKYENTIPSTVLEHDEVDLVMRALNGSF
ncbi:MAG: hypothetical protein JNL74_10480 [Fibrobacteres bacterium]|nr:hypothetical protein [Fibrobacterota bacterium]